MKLTLTEEEIEEMLVEDYNVDDSDARDAVVAAKALDLIRPDATNEANAEKVYNTKKCW